MAQWVWHQGIPHAGSGGEVLPHTLLHRARPRKRPPPSTCLRPITAHGVRPPPQCYSTCGGKGYGECEADFEACLTQQCKEVYPNPGDEEGKACRETASLFHAATKLGGCTFFKQSQKAACDCSEHGGEGSDGRRRRRGLEALEEL